MQRREFVKTLSAAGVALYASDLMGDLVAQSPRGQVLQSRFKGLSDLSLGEARRLGCSYADIRFTRNVTDSVAVRDRIVTDSFGFGSGGHEESAGFGVRVIHSGVWGFASSPIVTEDEIRKVTAQATEVAKASAISKRFEVKLAPVPAYTDYWAVPVKVKPEDVSLDDKIAFLMGINEAALKVPGIIRVQSSMAFDFEWKYLATSEGSYLEQEIYRTAPNFTVSAFKDGKFKSRTFTVAPRTAGYEVVTEGRMQENVERICAEAIEHCTAPPVGVGLKDIVMTPNHAMLTIHEIVGHATELDRVVGYGGELRRHQLHHPGGRGAPQVRLEIFNVTADRNSRGLASSMGYDDDGVKTQEWPIVRDGILVDLQTNRETAHYIGARTSAAAAPTRPPGGLPLPPDAQRARGRRPSGLAHAGRDDRRREGRRHDRRPRELLHRPAALQRPVRRHIFWEIKDGQITRQVTDVTYQAITTDFWANLDAVTGPDEWEMHGTGGDAKGQPTQTQSLSHGSPGSWSGTSWWAGLS
jgi:TldD protein